MKKCRQHMLTYYVTPHFAKCTEAVTRRESAAHIRKKNTPRSYIELYLLHIYTTPKVTWTSYIDQLWWQ